MKLACTYVQYKNSKTYFTYFQNIWPKKFKEKTIKNILNIFLKIVLFLEYILINCFPSKICSMHFFKLEDSFSNSFQTASNLSSNSSVVINSILNWKPSS